MRTCSMALEPLYPLQEYEFWENREDLVRRLMKRFLWLKLLLCWVPTPILVKGWGNDTSYHCLLRGISRGQLREFGNVSSAVGRPRKVVPDSGLRKQAEVGWRLGPDSCPGSLEGERKARLTTLMTEPWDAQMFLVDHAVGSYLTLFNKPSAGPRRPQRKGLEVYCLVPRDWAEKTASEQPGWRCFSQGQRAQRERLVSVRKCQPKRKSQL